MAYQNSGGEAIKRIEELRKRLEAQIDEINRCKQMEQSLRESEEKYRFLVENSGDIIWKIDPKGRWEFISSNVERVTGYSVKEVLSGTIWDFLAPESRPLARKNLKKRIEGERIPPYVVEIVAKDGRMLPFEVVTSPIYDEKGRIVAIQGISRDITERMEAEAALKRSYAMLEDRVEERTAELEKAMGTLRAILDTVPIGLIVADASTRRISYYNQNAEHLVGGPVTGTDLGPAVKSFQLLYPDGNPIPPGELPLPRSLRQGEHVTNQEIVILRADGTKITVLTSSVPVRGKGDQITAAVASLTDITGFKKAQEALKKYQLLSVHARDIMLFIRLDGRLTEVNDAAVNVYGYTRSELLSMNIRDLRGPGTAMEVEAQMAVAEDKGILFETVHRRKDGSLFPVEVSSCGAMIGKQRVLLSIIRDITERKRAEDAIKESRNMLQLVIDNIPQFIFWKDINSVYMGCNKNFAIVAGVSTPQDIVGKTDFELAWKPIEAESFREYDRRVMDTDTPEYHIIEPQLQADGKEAWLDENKIPLHDAEGRVVGILGTYEDITDRIRAEEALKEAKAQAELYLDLMGHDINNLNQIAMGYLELALETIKLEGKIDEDHLPLLTKPLEAMKNSSQLIDNLRKIQQATGEEMKLERIDLGSLLESLAHEYSNVPGRDVKINYVPAIGCYVMANALLRDVFANVIGNAIRHSIGALTVDITVRKIKEEGIQYYRTVVEDNGPGIPDELKYRLFSRSTRGYTKVPGRGLGLYLVKTLIEKFKGKAWVEDRVPGDHTKGAKFNVMLPALH